MLGKSVILTVSLAVQSSLPVIASPYAHNGARAVSEHSSDSIDNPVVLPSSHQSAQSYFSADYHLAPSAYKRNGKRLALFTTTQATTSIITPSSTTTSSTTTTISKRLPLLPQQPLRPRRRVRQQVQPQPQQLLLPPRPHVLAPTERPVTTEADVPATAHRTELDVAVTRLSCTVSMEVAHPTPIVTMETSARSLATSSLLVILAPVDLPAVAATIRNDRYLVSLLNMVTVG